MPDYIQLLESKLSPNQKQALNAVTDLARARSLTVFLTGGAVRDIVSGASVRDLDITIQGNPFKIKKDLEKAGFVVTGEHEPSQTIFLRFGNQARLEISAARTENFPKPARPEYHPAGILDDLRRRDFTANAMALSLNEGSWGLLLDPLNGSADISARQLRLVNNYGFLEDPIRMVRAARLMSRTGWELDERTKARYQNAKAEGVVSAISAVQRGYELEEIAYEEEPLQILKALESEGWTEHLFPPWTSHSADLQGLERLRQRLVQLLMAGLNPDPSAAQFRLLTAKLSPNHLTSLKRLFVRRDLIGEMEALDTAAKKLLQQISAKDSAKSSQLWRLFHSARQEAVLWLFFTGKNAAIQNRFDDFFTKWPEARKKIPNAILHDMRILPDVQGYDELLDKLTFAFMDGDLPNEEAIRKFAEPYSPPAPPPPVIVRRSRSVKRVVPAKGTKAARVKKSGKESGLSVMEESVETSSAGVTTPGSAGTSEAETASSAKPGSPKAGVAKSDVVKPGRQGISVSSGKPAANATTPLGKSGKTKVSTEKGRESKHMKQPVGKAAIKGLAAAKVNGPARQATATSKSSGKTMPRSDTRKAATSSVPARAAASASAKPAHKTISKSSSKRSSGKAKSLAKTTAKMTGPKTGGHTPAKAVRGKAAKQSAQATPKKAGKPAAKSDSKAADQSKSGLKKKSGR